VFRLFQAHLLEALAPIGGLVQPVTVSDAPLAVILATADPDDVRVRLIDGHAPNRVDVLAVEDRRPGGSRVDGLPDAARPHRHVVDVFLGGMDREVADPPGGQGRADAAELESREGP